MTFTPSVLSKDDINNSNKIENSTTNYPGTSSDTTGYNSIIITINTNRNSTAGGLILQFSADGSNFDTYYTDTVFAGSPFIKNYPILKRYYKINFTTANTSGTTTILSRLSTQEYNSNIQTSINVFNNSQENIYDAFGKLRVTQPNTIIDLRVPGQDESGLGTTGSTAYVQNDLQMCYAVSGNGGGTGFKRANNSQTDIFVSGNYTFTNQSRKYCVYQPGKSLLFMGSGVMDAGAALNYGGNTNGMKSRIGYFDNNNGLYFEYDSTGYTGGIGSTTCSVCLRTAGGSTGFNQQSWNIDKMDGTGPSGLILDWKRAQLFVIDVEWLGVGRVRYGFYAYGKIQYCHEILNINFLTNAPFTNNINLPIRYELQGTIGGTGAMIQICSTVISEGGYSPVGRPFSVSRSNVSVSSGIEGSILFLKGGGNNYYHQNILPTNISIASTAVNDVFILRLKLYLPENITGTTITWSNVSNYSVAQYGISGTITGTAIIVDELAVSGRGSSSLSGLGQVFTDLLQITSNVNNISSILEITVQGTFGGGSAVYATLNWSEIY